MGTGYKSLSVCSLILMILMANPLCASSRQDQARRETPPADNAPGSKNSPATVDAAWPFRKKIVHEGVSVEFSMNPVQADKKLAGKFQEDDDIVFSFSISDTTTEGPMSGVYPAAWMDLRAADEEVDAKQCMSKVASFLSGSIFSRAELDLNVYYVVALNNDATLTVVDPLFGFNSTKLLAMVPLKSPGEDWSLTSDQAKLFVSMPDSNQIAVVDTAAWKVIALVDAGSRPARLALQPDEQYLWVATGDSGVAAVNTSDLKIAARIPTGKGPHQIALSNDNRFAFITNADEGTVSIIDIRKLEKIKDIKVGRQPASVAFSSISQMAYAASEEDGAIAVIDGNRQEMVAQMKAEPGLGQIRFAPGGRLGFVVNPERDVVHIFDAALNRIVQTGDMEDGPDQVAFSDELAYVRHRGSETVLMIPLDEIGIEGKPVPVVDFPGGQTPFGKASRPSPADAIVQAPGANAVLIANPADRAIYFYKEGMAAPMGNFSNYSREPRAVLVVDRSIKERSPGVYETTAKLRRPGIYDVAFFLDSPRIVHCFEVKVDAKLESAEKKSGQPVHIEPLIDSRQVRVGERVRLRFKLTDVETKRPRTDLKDVSVLAFLAPGVWHTRQWAESAGEGIYEIDFTAPRPGIYYVYLESQSLGLSFNNSQYLVLQAVEGVKK